jgi:hypothetical protein
MRIELSGFNGHGWRVCDTCPCGSDGECYFRYTREKGVLDFNTGQVIQSDERKYSFEDGWYYVIIRPQECIDKHGR